MLLYFATFFCNKKLNDPFSFDKISLMKGANAKATHKKISAMHEKVLEIRQLRIEFQFLKLFKEFENLPVEKKALSTVQFFEF